MGLFYVHQGRSKKKKLPETESLKNARLEHRKFLFSKGIDPDKKINPKEFSAVANWWETTSVQKPAVLAHSVEQLICNHQVASSIPAHGTSLKQESQHNWRLEESKKFTVAPAYNKGAYQVIPRSEVKDIGR
jgi:hypothetical protein|tara:strand:- start:146 stop:541 length:396 start_codon:yes stop_codon:yes gene_type:complete